MAANSTAITEEISDSKKLLQEIALQRVYEICQARIRYNKQLMNFCLTGSVEEIKQYFKELTGGGWIAYSILILRLAKREW